VAWELPEEPLGGTSRDISKNKIAYGYQFHVFWEFHFSIGEREIWTDGLLLNHFEPTSERFGEAPTQRFLCVPGRL
jgi:hypothetical protein